MIAQAETFAKDDSDASLFMTPLKNHARPESRELNAHASRRPIAKRWAAN